MQFFVSFPVYLFLLPLVVTSWSKPAVEANNLNEQSNSVKSQLSIANFTDLFQSPFSDLRILSTIEFLFFLFDRLFPRHELIALILVCLNYCITDWIFPSWGKQQKFVCLFVCLSVGSTSCEFRFQPFCWLPLARSFLRRKKLEVEEKKLEVFVGWNKISVNFCMASIFDFG